MLVLLTFYQISMNVIDYFTQQFIVMCINISILQLNMSIIALDHLLHENIIYGMRILLMARGILCNNKCSMKELCMTE